MKINIWKHTGIMVLVGMLIAIATVVGATQEKGDKSRKDGILLVAFGTSETKAKVSFDNIHRLAARHFKNIPIRWAYTSDIIRRKLAKQGTEIDSPMVALAKMHDEGFTHVAVQSLHTIAGAEYDELKDTVSIFQTGSEAFDRIVLGRPLLWSFVDMKRVVKAMLEEVPVSRKKNEIIVLMGHGSEHHPGDLAYTAAAWMFQQADPLVFLGTVEGHPDLDAVLAQCKAAKAKKVYLMPFMSVAGDHARNDLAGDEEDSWKSVLEKNGIACVLALKGTAEYDSIANVWVEHLETAVKAMR